MTDTEWEAWCARPGTDAFGYPWSSWIRNPALIGKPMRVSEHQADQIALQMRMIHAESTRPRRPRKSAADIPSSSQMELCL